MRSTSRIIAAAMLVVIPSLVSCAATDYSSGRTYFGFTIGLESAPPPPRLMYVSPPRYYSVEYSQVQLVDSPDPNYDVFRYGGTFYLYSSTGYWYSSDRYDGPYRIIEVHTVPQEVLIVPEDHWRHRPYWDHRDRG